MKVKRHIGLPEGEMAIIPDMDTLVHNIVNSELKEKDQEITRLNNIIKELEKDLKSKIEWNENILKEDNGKPDLLGFNFHREAYIKIWEEVLDKLKELKEGNK